MNLEPVSAAVLDAAIAWQLRLQEDDTRGCQAALERWLDEAPVHRRAWQQLQGIDRHLASVDNPLARQLLQRPRERRLPRRGLLGLALLAALGLGIAQHRPLGDWLADERTGRGEQRSLTLTDDSHIRLNSLSALDIRFDERQRTLYLRSGEVLVETAGKADPRPFIVQTEQGSLRALGTRFLVRREGERTRLVVLQSAVEAKPLGRQPARVARAGEQLLMARDHLGQAEPAPLAADAWSKGMLVVEDMPLAELLARLGEYHSGYLGLDDSLKNLRISGSFPLHDTDKALAALPASLPVRIERLTDWWLMVRAARD
ncbi:FecR family protein [Stutzerimonas kirkiae]|uniref:Amino acid ABC transporter substrate-binding protein n=1 Tax=Stutzerimonas kirkiae TaxID=2211392 RepID=A0A4Q9QYR7_9GAMM|nr:FecR family protein [Stutzerimonas kirkiae]TBU89046.1 amino acid ABC transporter substrate-binding protein [Stutzerimonas kirkiae]TBU99387.1 amino acid ABC transporter substrate-binding protein [Stutzerimonas kirkiae]TBV03852.1 amino acid ABC transporter substrate-binding protein [Stutzerimonas kirkiae]TBV14892.1 amino acid ABC transporter substrate-binding protein [Stutzerimonas kirkiae]